MDTKTSMVKASAPQLPLNTERLKFVAVTVRHPSQNTLTTMKVTTMKRASVRSGMVNSREVTVSSREATVSSREAMASSLTLSQPIASSLTLSQPIVSSLTLSQPTVSSPMDVRLMADTVSRDHTDSHLTVSSLTASSPVAMVAEAGD